MNIIFRTSDTLFANMRRDLERQHAFAFERVGFLSVKAASTDASLVLLAQDYYPVADEDYIDDPSVGAMMGQEAIRKALNIALLNSVGVFHVHLHELPGNGRHWFSAVDLREQLKFVPDFFKVCSKMPHGALVLSPRSAAGRVWLAPKRIEPITEFNILGSKLQIVRAASDGSTSYYG